MQFSTLQKEVKKMINAINIIPHKTASCSVFGDYAIAQKRNIKWSDRKKGDIVLFDFNHNGTSDHVGIVVSVNKDGSITTIEGNTSSGSNTNGGQVQKRTRYKSQVNYFVRPKYTKEVTADMIIATAKAELGVKESPKNSNNVKYNTWFYGKTVSGSAYPWCMVFVCWVYAHVKEQAKPATTNKTPKADKLTAKAKELAWPVGTPTKKYAYKKGAPTSKMKTALKKRGYDSRVEYSDCGYCINTVIHSALGIKTKVLDSPKKAFPAVSGFEVIYKGKKIVKGVLKPGDIIRYKKKSGSQHVLMYIGNNDLAEGGRKIRFFVAKHFPKLSKAKFNKANVKKSTLQVLRVKE